MAGTLAERGSCSKLQVVITNRQRWRTISGTRKSTLERPNTTEALRGTLVQLHTHGGGRIQPWQAFTSWTRTVSAAEAWNLKKCQTKRDAHTFFKMKPVLMSRAGLT